MKLKELVQNLKESGNVSWKMFDLWVQELEISAAVCKLNSSISVREELTANYHQVYGFLRGLQSLEYITDEEMRMYGDELINIAYNWGV